MSITHKAIADRYLRQFQRQYHTPARRASLHDSVRRNQQRRAKLLPYQVREIRDAYRTIPPGMLKKTFAEGQQQRLAAEGTHIAVKTILALIRGEQWYGI
jgi:hypothetical protein